MKSKGTLAKLEKKELSALRSKKSALPLKPKVSALKSASGSRSSKPSPAVRTKFHPPTLKK